ncbi:MAG: hypothetical protein HZC23_13070 [Rhodocyclales bacterium]|nr:hypothetical protein [Rhodocyclales bacterium]
MSGYWRHLFLSAAMLVAAPLLAVEVDPPSRVGRISLAHEGTHLRIGNAVAIGGSSVNWPLTTGALIDTANEARTEARIGSTTFRLDGGTTLEFVELSDERIWLRLNRGSMVLGIRNPEQAAEMTLDTPQGRLRFDTPGIYRADVVGGTTAFSVYQGTARIEDYGLTVRAGDRILLLGGADRTYLLGQSANDTFRQWSLAREQLGTRGENRYLPPEMTGHEELDRHGDWRETSEYGPAWFPQGIPVGWAPYRWGRWAWVSPWGWTWIDHASWGFAPFHYGRWALIGGNWAWLPGAYVARPVYAPALIVWLGQPGWSASLAFGSGPAVGWFPLGPREVYYPSYRSSLRHVRNINATHVTNVTGIVTATPPPRVDTPHVHRNRSEAVTMVPEKTLLSGAPVDRSAVVVRDKSTLASIPIASPPPPFGPTRGRNDPGAATIRQGYPAQPMQAATPTATKTEDPSQFQGKPAANRFDPPEPQGQGAYGKEMRIEPVGNFPKASAPPAQPAAPAAMTHHRETPQPRLGGTSPEIQSMPPQKSVTSTPVSRDLIPAHSDKPTSSPHSPVIHRPAVMEPMRSAPRHADTMPAHSHHVPGNEKVKESGPRDYTKQKQGRQDP